MMISFRKSQQTGSIITYEMAAITPGIIQINKNTKEIKFIKLDPEEDKEELIAIIKEKIINENYPDEALYAAA